jgi:hypothetical protein
LNWGYSTLIGRASARWERVGKVEIDPSLGHSSFVTDAVREFVLDPSRDRMDELGLGLRSPAGLRRCARVVRTDAPLRTGERRVEYVQDGWGVVYAQVLVRPCSSR